MSPLAASVPSTPRAQNGQSNGLKGAPNGRVRVVVRCRPRTAAEKNAEADFSEAVELEPEAHRLKLKKNNWDGETYLFDDVLSNTSSQKKVYEIVARPVVESVLEGYNGTIMAYGQTGTGKTYTLGSLGGKDSSQKGIMARAMEQLLESTDRNADSLSISYLQLYNERVQDLLSPDKDNLAVQEDNKTGEVQVPGATSVEVRDFEDFLQCLQTGEVNRAAANTKMNTESSRSHAILLVSVRKASVNEEGGVPTFRKGKLLIVDLAGSERLQKSGAEGTHAEEAKFINLSLTALGKCVNALAEGSPHIPTRDSKLTRLLRDSFGGSARTSLVITISPSAVQRSETASTIQFGQRAMKVENMVKMKEEIDYKTLQKKTQAELDHMTAQMEIRESEIELREALVEQKLAQADAQRAEFNRKFEEQAKEMAASKDALAAARKKHADELTRIKKQLATETQARQALAADLAAVRQSAEQNSASQADSDAQLSGLQSALAQEQGAREAVEAQLAESSQSAEDLRTAVENLTAENERLRAEVEGLKAQVEELRSYSFKRNGSPVGGSPKTDERPKLSTGKLFESQDLEKILVLLENEDLNVRVHAVKVLANLAAEESNQEKIVEAGGLQSLLNLLDSTDDETCRRVAAGALANLAMNETNQELIMNAQGVHLLVGVSEAAEDPQTLRMVAGAIANLCGNEKVQQQLREEGGLRALLSMASTQHTEVLAQIARGFANFAKCDKSGKSMLIEEGALGWLVEHATAPTASVKRHVELALCHLAQHEVNAEDMVAENALAELERISRESLREDVRELAAKVISESPTFQQHLL